MNRIIVGSRGSEVGLWISKPGQDASSTNDADMLVSTQRFLVQPYLQGRIFAPSNGQGAVKNSSNTRVSMVVTHNLGYIPVVETFGNYKSGGAQAFAKVTTTKILLMGVADNSVSGGYWTADIFYVIFRTMMAVS